MINVFTSNWGDYYGPLIWRIDDSFPSTFAYRCSTPSSTATSGRIRSMSAWRAGVLMSIVPAVLFFIFQKQLIEGVAMDGLKG